MKQRIGPGIQKIMISVLGVTLTVGIANTFGDDPARVPETGAVKWSSDLESTLQKSKKTGRPVFLLFQEIPG
jgi:hypothetical protein